MNSNKEFDDEDEHQQQCHDINSGGGGGGGGGFYDDDKIFNNYKNNKNLDYPPYSRLFVLYPKTATENELKVEFERYGPIEDLWVVKEKETGLAKGIAYIKYTKASHAAKSIEELNGKLLSNRHAKPLKVIISNSKNDKKSNSMTTLPVTVSNTSSSSSTSSSSTLSSSSTNNNLQTQTSTTATATNVIDNDRMLRLFVVIPKDFRKKDLRDAFKKFGEIENVQIIFNRLTNENKGFGYVRFYKASDAARALEECHPKFKPKFAEPYSVKLAREREKNTGKYLMQNSLSTNSISVSSSSITPPLTTSTSLNNNHQPISSSSSSSTSALSSGTNNNNNNNNNLLTQLNNIPSSIQQNNILKYDSYSSTCSNDEASLLVKCSGTLTRLNLISLFNLIPGLLEIKLLNVATVHENNEAYYLIRYETNMWASYAQQKLNKFHYPTGEILTIIQVNLNNLNIQLSLMNKFSSLQLSSHQMQQQQQQQQQPTQQYNYIQQSQFTTTSTNPLQLTSSSNKISNSLISSLNALLN